MESTYQYESISYESRSAYQRMGFEINEVIEKKKEKEIFLTMRIVGLDLRFQLITLIRLMFEILITIPIDNIIYYHVEMIVESNFGMFESLMNV